LVLFLIHLQFVYLFCNLSVMQVNLVLRSDHHTVHGTTIGVLDLNFSTPCM
jgi:hypothetical protein